MKLLAASIFAALLFAGPAAAQEPDLCVDTCTACTLTATDALAVLNTAIGLNPITCPSTTTTSSTSSTSSSTSSTTVGPTTTTSLDGGTTTSSTTTTTLGGTTTTVESGTTTSTTTTTSLPVTM